MTRSFAEIHRKSQPTLSSAHIEASVAQRRRARTFSQIVAGLTCGGIDAGGRVGPFTIASRSEMGAQGHNQAPDWRGHYLGNDFSPVSFRERPARRVGNDFSAKIAERRLEKYSHDDDFHDQQEDTSTMSVSQDQIRRQAIEDPARTAAIHSKADIYRCVEEMAAAAQKPCESVAQARVRIGKTAEGAALLKAYSMAKAAPPVQKSAPVSEAEMRKSIGGPAAAQIDGLAKELQKGDPKLTIFKARDLARRQNPELAKQEEAFAKARNISGGRM